MTKTILAATAAMLTSAGTVVRAQMVNSADLQNTGSTITIDGGNFLNTGNGMIGGYSCTSAAGVMRHKSAAYTFTNDAYYYAGPGTDVFCGTGTATIAGSLAPEFGNLQFVGRSADTLKLTGLSGILIKGTLNWANQGPIRAGDVTMNNWEGQLRFGDTATYAGITNPSVQRIIGCAGKSFGGAGTFTLPIGDSTQLRPITVSVQAPYAFKAAYRKGSPIGSPWVSAQNMTPPTGIASISEVGNWAFSGGYSSGPIVVTISIPDMSGAGGYANAADMRLMGYNSMFGTWETLGTTGASGNAAGSTLSGTLPSTHSGVISGLAIGSTSAQPLPLRLTSFTAALEADCRAQIRWETASEVGVTAFVVEYGTDGRIFREVGSVPATGSGAYSYAFDGVQEGPGYFRLKSVEAAGGAGFSATRRVDAQCAGGMTIVASPNPFADALDLRGLQGETTVRVFTAAGQLVYEAVSRTATARIGTGTWAPGVYFLETSAPGATAKRMKVVKQ